PPPRRPWPPSWKGSSRMYCPCGSRRSISISRSSGGRRRPNRCLDSFPERDALDSFLGAPPPGPGLLFPRRKSRQKGAQEGDTFDCVPLLGTTPRNDTKGACPLWIPPHII